VTSIVEVARRANVSIATVSRVLSASAHPVSEETRTRVIDAAQALNYSPSTLAKAMVTGSTRIVGVIVGDSTDPYFAAIVRGVEDVARECGYLVIVCNSDRLPAIELNYLRTLNGYRADGVIFAGGGLTDPAYLRSIGQALNAFRSRGAAVVSLGKHLFDSLGVLVDNKQLMIDATEHLLSLGHSDIAYISGPDLLTTSALRLDGHRQALARHGLQPRDDRLLSGDYTFEAGLGAAAQLASQRTLPTAVLASNDLMAIGCLVGLKQSGYRVPQQISVMGIDDITAARFIDPPLTTVSIPLHEMGAIGMESLIKLRHGQARHGEDVMLAHKIIVRQSTAPVRKKADSRRGSPR
jgi:LacI family transcriptional regulator